ncbi:MAG: hypothetical protein ACL93V_12745 [Candidatus Electrothrix sp. YB6]
MKRRLGHKKRGRPWRLTAAAFSLAAGLVLGVQTAQADGAGNADVIPDVGCMEDVAGFGLNCTANDVQLANATNIVILDSDGGCAFPGDTVTFTADFEVLLTAQARHDVGIWFAQDGDPNGDGALTGACTAATPAYAPDLPWLDLDGTSDPLPGDNKPSGTQDTCGDIDDSHNPLFPSITLTVTCIDPDGNGKLNLPNCTSWRQPGANDLCTSPLGAFPGAPSKCRCDDGFEVDINVPPAELKVVKTAIPDSIPEPGGTVDFQVEVTNASTLSSVTLTQIADDENNDGTNDISYNASEVCLDTELSSLETTTCTFTRTLSGNAGDMLTDKVTAFGIDENSNEIEGGDTATVEITDVPSAVQVEKTVDPTSVDEPGGEVTYTIKVTNTSTVDAVTIDTVNDPDLDGDIRAFCGNPPLTFPVTLAPNEFFTCTVPSSVEGNAGDLIDNTASASGIDDDGNPVSDDDIATVAINNVPSSIMLTKSVAPEQVNEPGGDVIYTFDVTNTSKVDNVTINSINDPNLGGDISAADCSPNLPAALAPSEMVTCTVSSSVTGNAGDNIPNTATAYGVDDDGYSLSAVDSANVAILNLPSSIQVIKSVDPTMVDEPGGPVTYTIRITNTSSVDEVTIDTVNDELLGGDISADCDATVPVTLAPNAYFTCTVSGSVEGAAGDMIPNTASASGTDDDGESVSGSDGALVEIKDVPSSVVLTKTANPTSLDEPGGEVSFTVVIENTSPVDALTLTGLNDNIYGDLNGQGDCSVPQTIAVGDSYSCSFTGQVNGNAGETHIDTVTGTLNDDDEQTHNPSDDATVEIITAPPELAVVKDNDADGNGSFTDTETVPATATYPKTIPYQVAITNNSGSAATITAIGDTPHDIMGSSCAALLNTTINADQTVTCTFNATFVNADSGSVTNTFEVTADNTAGSDTASDTSKVNFEQNPAMTVEKSSTTTGLSAPATVPYSYLVSNTGNVTLTGISLADNNIDAETMNCPATTLAVGDNMTCTATHTFTQDELNAGGTLDNTVTADSEETDPVTDDLSIPIEQNPAMTVEKSSTTTGLSAPATVPYSYLVSNTGNVTLTGISLADNNIDAETMNCPATTLAVGDNMTCTATHTFTQDELNAGGTLDNTVTADSEETDPVTDDLSIPIEQNPAMTVEKSSTTTGLSAPATVPYSYLVSNTGNVTLTGISLADNNIDAETMNCPATTLAVGDNMTCTATHTFTQDELNAGGTLDNTVTADSEETDPVTDDLSIPIEQNPAMTVEKSSTTTGLSAPATVPYSYLVSNTGNVTLTGISLADNNIDAETMNCPATTLAVGDNMTCTATHTFTQDELNAGGTLDNTVTADSEETDPVTDDLSIPIEQNPAMTVEKSSTTTGLSAPATVPYSYLVSNTGNVTLTGISLADNNIDAETMNCPATTLAVGDNMTCTATHTFTQDELNAGGTLDNTVTADSEETDPVTDDLSIPIEQNPAMTVEKSSTTTGLSAPATVPYSYLVSNTGNVTLTGISLADNNIDAETMNCPATTLAVGDNMTCTATHTFTQDELNAGGTLDNTVTADSEETDPVTDDLSIPIEQNPAMTVEKSSTTTGLSAPATVPYSYLVSNTGNVTLTGISLADNNIDAETMNCPATTLAVGDNMTCTATHTFTQDELNAGGTLDNTVTADSEETDPVTDDLSIPIEQNPAMTVEKSSTTTGLSAPATVPYSYLVSNTGNVTLTGISLADNNIDAETMNCPATTLAVGDNMTCTATHTFTQDELNAGGTLDNTVTADSEETDPVTDDLSIPIEQNPAMTVEKSSTTTGLSAPATVPYSYLVSNTGNVTLTGISLADNNIDAETMNCPATTLAVGDNMTCTATHTFTQDELNAGGTLDNTVTADSEETDPVTDDLSIPIEQNPAMTVEKSSTTTGLSAPATVPYSYLVSNTGNVTLTGISLADNNIDAETMNCPATTLAVGDNMTCTATHTFTQDELNAGGTLDNTVTADSEETDPVTDDLSIPIEQNPAMTVEKSSTTTGLSAPATVPYSYLVSNTGNVTLTGISLADNNIDAETMNCPATTLAVGDNMTCTATHTFTQDELNAGGTLDNTVTADSEETDPVTDDLSIPIEQNPAMTVEKSSTTTGLSAPATVPYSYLVSNTGNVTLTGISLADNNIDAETMNCPATTLAVGDNMTCTATHTFTQDELNAGGTLDNTVTADSEETDPVTDDLSIPIEQNPAMTVEKSSTTTGLSAPATVPYSYLVSNTGNVTLTGISLADNNIDAETMNCPATTLAVGDNMTCTATHTFTQDELNAGGTLDNTVTADSEETDPVTDDLSIPIEQNPAMTVEKSSTTTGLSAPATVPYSYLVSNTGNVTLTGISLADNNIDAETMNCPATTLAVGDNMTCTATHTFTQDELNAGGTLDNTVTADSEETDPVTDDLSIPIEQNPAMTVEKSSTTTGLSAPATVPYSYLVSNTGNVTLTGISLADNNIDAETMNCPATTLAVGDNMTCTATHTFTQDELNAGGTLDNTVTADSEETDPVTDDLSIPIEQNPAMTLVKSADPATYSAVGDMISYSYEVTNSGNVTVSGQITVADDKSDDESCPAGDLAPGAAMTCTASYTITQDDLDNGSVTNVATATGKDPNDSPVTSNQDDETVTADIVQECAPCDGKITDLTLKYTGASEAVIRVKTKGKKGTVVFEKSVAPGEEFQFIGQDKKGTLGTEITIYVDGIENTKIHTSCSVPIGPGLVSGDFEVIEAHSRNGGLTCPVD